ncbi:MAG: hypothetical protein JO250_17315 [Armatimonadetes bacterium]|nr:hypothetical protein [Armatimonadota bacterium]
MAEKQEETQLLKRLSNADDEQLHYYLARIREIAILGDEAALVEADKLIWEITEREDEGWDDSQGVLVSSWNANYEEMVAGTGTYAGDKEIRRQNATERLEKFRQKVDSNTVTFFDINHFRQVVEYMGTVFPHGPQVQDEELHKIRAECLALADRAEPVALNRTLEECLSYPFSNINSVLSMVSHLNQAIMCYT